MRVLRISHSGVVDSWRERERVARTLGAEVHSVTARRWDTAGRAVALTPHRGEDVEGVHTWGTHPALFVYDPRPLWRLLGQDWDLLDLHEEPFALATAEVLALRALRGSRVPYLLYSAQNIPKRYPIPFRWLERWALRHAHAASVCNTQAGHILRSKGLTGPAQVIGLGVDTTHFRPAAGSRPADERAHVGYVGRLAPHKGIDVLIEAVARDDRHSLVVAGSGPQEERLRRLATERACGRVHFAGPVSHEDLPAFYRDLDVLAVPSLTTPGWIEQFGRVAVEAMACGVPVVASDSGALPDVVGDVGLLVPPGDPVALGLALRRVTTDAALAQRMRTDGIARARQYDWQVVGREYVSMYEDVAKTDRDEADRGPEIIVVAYHHPDMLRRTLQPLAHLPLTVVDNSSDAGVAVVCAELGVRYLDPGHNGGFAAGVNHGLAHRVLPGADVLLLNPDAVIDEGGLRELQAALRSEPDLASVAPAQVDGTGSTARVAWPYPSPWGTALEALGLGRLRADDYVIGSVLLLRGEALAQVGAMDESFFLYAEETDWARRAGYLGWRHRLVPEVTALHLGAATSSDPARREAHFHGSQERYHRKHFGSIGWQVTRAATVIGSAVRVLLLRGARHDDARDRVARYLRGPLRVESTLRRPTADRDDTL